MEEIRMESVVVERHTGWRILDDTMRQAIGRTRDASPRQLPTDHDCDGAPQWGRSANIRLINRRHSRLGRHPLHPDQIHPDNIHPDRIPIVVS